jgi:hypothetical protein
MSRSNPELFQKALDELDVPIPRKLKYRSFREAGGLWFLIFAILLMDLCCFAWLTFFKQASWFSAQYGDPAVATVDFVTTYYTPKNHVLHYETDIHYSADGKVHVGSVDNVGRPSGDLKPGAQVKIHYLPIFSDHPALDPYPPHDYGVAYLFPLGMLLFLVFVFFYGRDLLKNGEVVIATITGFDMWVSGAKVALNGEPYKVSWPLSRGLEDVYFTLTPGEEIIVLADPNKPKRNIVYIPGKFIRVPVKDRS